MSNDLSPSGSRWEPFSSPRPVLAHPDDRPEHADPTTPAFDDPTDVRAAPPVHDITPTTHPVPAGPPGGRRAVRRTVVLVATTAGLLLAGGAGGYALGHATAGPGDTAGITGATGGFGGERHRFDGQGLDGQGLGDGGPQGGTVGTPDAATGPQT